LTATRTTHCSPTQASQQKRWPATRPGSITPMGDSIGAVATATSWEVRISASGEKPSTSRHIRTDCLKPPLSRPSIGPPDASSGVPSNIMMWRTTSGAS
jgi:hypothetical protein